MAPHLTNPTWALGRGALVLSVGNLGGGEARIHGHPGRGGGGSVMNGRCVNGRGGRGGRGSGVGGRIRGVVINGVINGVVNGAGIQRALATPRRRRIRRALVRRRVV